MDKLFSLLNNLFSFLNNNAGAMQVIFVAMQVIFAAVVTMATVSYVIFTLLMWREMRRTNERLEQPNVQAIFETSPSYAPLTRLTIRNIGNVSVHDLSIDIDPQTFPGLGSYIFLKEISLFQRSIPVLCENQEISTLLFSFFDIKGTWFEDSTLTFKLSYKTPTGQQRDQTYSYDLAVYKKLPYLTEKGIKDIVKPLEDIVKSLEDVARNLKTISSRK